MCFRLLIVLALDRLGKHLAIFLRLCKPNRKTLIFTWNEMSSCPQQIKEKDIQETLVSWKKLASSFCHFYKFAITFNIQFSVILWQWLDSKIVQNKIFTRHVLSSKHLDMFSSIIPRNIISTPAEQGPFFGMQQEHLTNFTTVWLLYIPPSYWKSAYCVRLIFLNIFSDEISKLHKRRCSCLNPCWDLHQVAENILRCSSHCLKN